MPLKKICKFDSYSVEGREFVRLWNRGYPRKELAEKFNLSIPSICRLRRRLGLEKRYSINHPANKAFKKSIRKLYYKGFSTKSISEILGRKHYYKASDESIRRVLIKLKIPRRTKWDKNVLYNRYTSGCKHSYSPSYLRKTIKKLYEEGMPLKYISQKLRIDEDSVMLRVKALNLPIRIGGQSHIKYILKQKRLMADNNVVAVETTNSIPLRTKALGILEVQKNG